MTKAKAPHFPIHTGGRGGWTEWISPKHTKYLMMCCDCGLVHEMQFKVAKFKPRPSQECEFLSDPDIQALFRVRRQK